MEEKVPDVGEVRSVWPYSGVRAEAPRLLRVVDAEPLPARDLHEQVVVLVEVEYRPRACKKAATKLRARSSVLGWRRTRAPAAEAPPTKSWQRCHGPKPPASASARTACRSIPLPMARLGPEARVKARGQGQGQRPGSGPGPGSRRRAGPSRARLIPSPKPAQGRRAPCWTEPSAGAC